MASNDVILITGASGMVSSALANKLLEKGYSVRFLSRTKNNENQFVWDISKSYIEPNALENVKHIIHLAGANISKKRWTKSRKKQIIDSRVLSSRLLFDEVKKQKIELKTFITATAVGYYGTSKIDVLYTEDSPNGYDFLAKVCFLWEKEADNFLTLENTRVVKFRFGVVLDSKGGALKQIIQPIKLGFGAVLGTGKQYIPWIHIDDLCNLLLFTLKNTAINGVYNAVAPEYINNKDLTQLIAKKLNKPLWLPSIPSFILKLLLGEMATIALNGNRVSSKKLQSTGFNFKYPTIDKALNDLL